MAEVTSTATYDYSMIGSFGSDATQSVNGDMINKIRAAEEADIIDPITEDIDNLALEAEKIEEIKTKISEFSDVASYFNLYNEENVFNQFLFDTSGSAAVYDVVDMSAMQEGTTSINITQLAQKDVYQSSAFSTDPSNTNPTGNLLIKLGDEIVFGEDTNNDGILDSALDISSMTYDELAQVINAKEGLNASIEQVGDNSYKLVIKSEETGEANILSINGTANLGFVDTTTQSSNINVTGTDLVGAGELNINGNMIVTTATTTYQDLADMINGNNGYSGIDGISANLVDGTPFEISTDDGTTQLHINQIGIDLGYQSSKTQFAQNLNATIDGVSYDTSSNSITTQDSLKITAVELGTASVTISKDNSAVTVAAEALATQYNELVSLINEELYDSDSVIGDKDTLRTILNDIKNMLFQNYGADTPEFDETNLDEYGDIIYDHSNVTNNDKNIFMFGFALDKSGELSVDTDILNDIINGEDPNYNIEDLQNVFTGAYENKGLGVQIYDYLDALDGYNGLLSTYETNMITREEELNEEKEEELERLDTKYNLMAEQYSQYSSIIAQMEASFSGLKMLIEQSTASS